MRKAKCSQMFRNQPVQVLWRKGKCVLVSIPAESAVAVVSAELRRVSGHTAAAAEAQEPTQYCA